jgi:hypothetical protein
MRRHWRIAVVLLVQAGILAAMAGRHVAARAWGTPVTLRTAPVDPYDFMSGYHLVLQYEVEQAAAELLTPGPERSDRLWIVVRRAEPAWDFVGATRERPEVAADQVALRARWGSWRGAAIEGAGRIYIPETERALAEELFRDAGGRALVDLRVGGDGTVALLRLRVGGASFGD